MEKYWRRVINKTGEKQGMPFTSSGRGAYTETDDNDLTHFINYNDKGSAWDVCI
jgi:hypothetical protein